MAVDGVGNQTPRLVPEELSSDKLKESINVVLNRLTGQTIGNADLGNVQISEDVLYASIIHQRLKETHPKVSDQFLDSMAKNYNKNVKNEARQPLSKAVDAFLGNLVTKKTITGSQKERLEAFAFGKAQLDNRKSTLARAPENVTNKQAASAGQPTLDAALSRVSANKAATKSVIESFDTRLERNPKLNDRQVAAQKDVLERMLPKKASTDNNTVGSGSTGNGGTGNGGTTVGSTGSSENDREVAVHDASKDITGPEDFTYKVESERDKKFVFIIPKRYSDKAVGASLITSTGEEVELKTTLGDDDRRYFRGDKSGKEFEGLGKVRVRYSDGSHLDFTVPDMKKYFNQNY